MNESANGDYHDQKNSSNNEKWVQEKLIPNMVVFDKAPQHCVQVGIPASK
jgi:hypothetical protein